MLSRANTFGKMLYFPSIKMPSPAVISLNNRQGIFGDCGNGPASSHGKQPLPPAMRHSSTDSSRTKASAVITHSELDQQRRDHCIYGAEGTSAGPVGFDQGRLAVTGVRSGEIKGKRIMPPSTGETEAKRVMPRLLDLRSRRTASSTSRQARYLQLRNVYHEAVAVIRVRVCFDL